MKLSDLKIGDTVYFRTKNRSKPLYGTIQAIYEKEDALQVMTHNDGFQCVHISNVALSEAQIKKQKYKDPKGG